MLAIQSAPIHRCRDLAPSLGRSRLNGSNAPFFVVVPSVVTVQPTVGETLLDDRFIPGTIATLVAWRTEDVLYTIVAGMGAFWVIRFGPTLLGYPSGA